MASKNTSLASGIPEAAGRGRSRGKTAKSNPTSAVGAVAKRTSNAAKKLEASKAAIQKTGTAVLHTGETLGTLVAASMAEGFLGQEKMSVGGVDVRAPIGLVTQGFGLYQMIKGEKGGEHALAVGNGAVGSWLASVGREAGQALRDRRDSNKGTPQAPAQPAPTSFKGEPVVTYPVGPAMQGNLPPGHAPHYGNLPAGYPLPAPAYGYGQQLFVPGQGWVPGQAIQQAQGFPGAPTPGGLLPEPGPHMSGTAREIMLTPETEVMEGTAPAGEPAPGADPNGFQGPQMFFTPEAQAQFQQQLQQGQQFRQQRRAALQQGLQHARQQAQQAHQAHLAQQGGAMDADGTAEPAVEGGPADSGSVPELAGPHRFRRASLRPINYDRFPSGGLRPEAGRLEEE